MAEKSSESELSERRDAVVRAASEVFLRYGYSRTTMVELANAAHLSRPTLYEVFPGKDEIFGAVIHNLSESTLDRYREALPRLPTLRKKLHYVCRDWGTHGLRLMSVHPDAKDLFDLNVAAVREMYESFVRFLSELIATEQSLRFPRERLVRNLVYSFKGLKDGASTISQMEDMIDLQVDIFLHAFR